MSSKKDQNKTLEKDIIEVKEENVNILGATPDMLKGVYSNLAMITHTANEFKIDFAVKFAEKDAHLATRVIMSPAQMKALLSAMQENFSKYEKKFGIIEKKTDSTPVEVPRVSRRG